MILNTELIRQESKMQARSKSKGFGVAGWLMADLLVVLAFLILILDGGMGATLASDPSSSTGESAPETPALKPEPPPPGLDLNVFTSPVVNTPPGGGEAQADELARQILRDGRRPGVVMLFGVSWDGNALNGTLVSQAMENLLRARLPEGTVYRSFLQGFGGGAYRRGDVYAEVFYFTGG